MDTAITEINEFLKIAPAVKKAPFQLRKLSRVKYLWSSYDKEADVLYINFKKPSHATDSEINDNPECFRGYENGEVFGLTVLNASKR